MNVEAYLAAVRRQARDASRLADSLTLPPGDRVLNVHAYGLRAYEAFVRRYYGDGAPRVVAISMNPGPNGAVQTGIPFCDVGMARGLLPRFDDLVTGRPPWAASERVEMSGRKLVLWADAALGGLRGLYRRVLFAMTVPLSVLRVPAGTGGEQAPALRAPSRDLSRRARGVPRNVPLPALPRSETAKIDRFLERHAAMEIQLADPEGILLLGDYAAHVWEIVSRVDPVLARLPCVRVPHPAARIGNAAKIAAWSDGLEHLALASTARTRRSPKLSL